MKAETGRRIARWAGLAMAAALVGACAGSQDPGNADVRFSGTDPSGSAAAGAAGAAGVVQYDGYQAARARDGDTVGSIADRLGLSAAELGAYNGLGASHQLRAGDELVLPPRPGGYSVASAPAAAPVDTQPLPGSTAETLTEAPPPPAVEAQPLDTGIASTGAVDGTWPSAADPTDTGAAATTAWSPDLVASAIDRSDEGTPGSDSNAPPPPSAGAPLPPNPTEAEPLDSPNLSQYQTPTARPASDGTEIASLAPSTTASTTGSTTGSTGRLLRPVEGPIAVPFGPTAAGGRNDGVDFDAPAGTPVKASDDGTVALVSEALGGLGTIVLLRHDGDLLTVYGRIADVSVSKGALVSRGQQIGVVANTDRGPPRLHFEVRRGPESLDPAGFF